MWRTLHRIEKNSIAYGISFSNMDDGRDYIFVTRSRE